MPLLIGAAKNIHVRTIERLHIYSWNDPEYYDTIDVCKSVKYWKKTLDNVLDLMNDIDEVIEECTYYDVFAEAHGLLCDLHEEIKDDSDIEYLLEFDFVDRQDEETENYENRYEDWIAERDKDIIDEFNSVYDDFIGKEYLERTQEVFTKLKSIHKQIGMDPDFEKNLNNSDE